MSPPSDSTPDPLELWARIGELSPQQQAAVLAYLCGWFTGSRAIGRDDFWRAIERLLPDRAPSTGV